MADTATLWFFDFDGTLSPIVEDRRAAVLDAGCRAMLRELVARPGAAVAVISSRAVEDVAARVPVPGVYVGGSSGVTWMRNGKTILQPSQGLADELARMRRALLPEVVELAAKYPGVDLEDKLWSVSVHARRLSRDERESLFDALSALPIAFEGALYRGPECVELQFLAQVNKAFGVRALCGHLGIDRPGRIFYAGDDENDVVAMALVRHLGGDVLCVGRQALCRDAPSVADISELPSYVAGRAAAWGSGAPAA